MTNARAGGDIGREAVADRQAGLAATRSAKVPTRTRRRAGDRRPGERRASRPGHSTAQADPGAEPATEERAARQPLPPAWPGAPGAPARSAADRHADSERRGGPRHRLRPAVGGGRGRAGAGRSRARADREPGRGERRERRRTGCRARRTTPARNPNSDDEIGPRARARPTTDQDAEHPTGASARSPCGDRDDEQTARTRPDRPEHDHGANAHSSPANPAITAAAASRIAPMPEAQRQADEPRRRAAGSRAKKNGIERRRSVAIRSVAVVDDRAAVDRPRPSAIQRTRPTSVSQPARRPTTVRSIDRRLGRRPVSRRPADGGGRRRRRGRCRAGRAGPAAAPASRARNSSS